MHARIELHTCKCKEIVYIYPALQSAALQDPHLKKENLKTDGGAI
jgi:hypothetical protein